MSKKALYFEAAERLFVVDQLSVNEVAMRIGKISERTIRTWKEEGS